MKKYAAIILSVLILSCKTNPIDKFDKQNAQSPVLTHACIDSVLAEFEVVDFADLDKEYTNSNGKFKSSLKKEKFYVLEGDDVLKYIVGEYRIRNFVTTDAYYSRNEKDYTKNKKQFWLVDKKMLYMMLDLILKLDENGYNKYGFHVRESHRHPTYNEKKGGASSSQHIWGKAVDIVIQDINNDGKKTQADKTIVLDIMEEIVGNNGGLGRYPGSMTVHFDFRGHRARWDFQ
ncbi:MAG: D-Ala-D-Ala carboxypeptidase family metallohydrolase [Crocinitomix sp.]|nr:D-Ala-D-Ala carboxypeptidase family metallohydrolase [Crocinitomix sp.]